MTLDLSRWPEADALLDEALGLPEDERPAFVQRVAAGDAALAGALARVLAEAAAGDDFLAPAGALSGVLGAEIREAYDAGPEGVLAPGARVEHYAVEALIGRGGMGEVYRARDLRLNRLVALKVLPERFAADPGRLARFRREAQVLATFAHPGIAGIHGLAEEGRVEALVLELVEGPTLADRIAEGPLPLDEVVAIARQLVDAIDAAHARGILHRDLKPANVKLAEGGRVKVLDFGLAKALLAPSEEAATTDLTGEAGAVLLGTAPYMSPEQTRGRAADQRSDIWAFGCILFEMLTARRAFPGQVAADVLARVLEREPAYGLLPAGTPPPLRRLLRRCLEKDPARRLGYIGDARLELDDAADEPALEPGDVPHGSPWRLVATFALVALVAAGAWFARGGPAPGPPAVTRFVLEPPAGATLPLGFQPIVAVSPDGRTVVFRASVGGVMRLYRRDMASLESVPIEGTENALGPFFSPDGRWLGFDGGGVLKRVSLDGGAPVAIGPAPGNATATWAPDDTVIFATNTGRVLQRIPLAGGPVETLTSLDAERGDTLHLLPQALADGRHVVYTIVSGAERRVARLDLETGETRVITEGSHGRYLPGGRLVFLRGGGAWSAPVDLAAAALTGEATPVVPDVEATDGTVMHLDVSASGTLAYLPAQPEDRSARLTWFDRQGREQPVALEPAGYTRVALAPDGPRVALALEADGNTDVWVGDLDRGTMSRLTRNPTIETQPVWSPDGQSVTFRSEREGPGIFRRDAQGAGPIERLTTTDGPIHSPYSWTPDGRTLLFAVFRSFSNQAIASVTPPDTAITMLLDGDFAQLDPQVSPDGRWLAYMSDETGRFEIYVRPYPDVEAGRWQVSTAGGRTPRWTSGGRELVYLRDDGIESARVAPGETFRAGAPRRLFAAAASGTIGPDFEVTSDGQRFLLVVASPEPARATPPGFVVVTGALPPSS
ncbi:MAG: protein kinase [Vicinamibacterales bacterium]